MIIKSTLAPWFCLHHVIQVTNELVATPKSYATPASLWGWEPRQRRKRNKASPHV